MLEDLQQQKTQSRMFRIVFIAWIFCMLGYLLSYVVVGGTTTMPLFGSEIGDQFSDLFNPMHSIIGRNGLQDVYATNDGAYIYPPFAFLVLRGFLQFLPDQDPFQSQYTDMLILLYSAICMLVLAYLFYTRLKNENERRRVFFLLFVFSSAPFLFLLERGNLLLLALVFSAFFLLNYKSKNAVIRELSLLSLAMAASLKIYPAVLGCMLLHDRNWKAAIRCGIYGIVMFFGPFFAMGGFEKIMLFIRNVQYAAEATSGYQLAAATLLNFSNSVAVITTFLGGSVKTGFQIASYLQIPLLLLVPVGVYLIKDDWKMALLLVLVMVLLPSFNWYYSACFYAIPLFLFLNNAHTRRIDYLYLILMCGTLLPVTFLNSLIANPYRLNADFAASGYLCNICGLLLICTFLLDLILNGKQRFRTIRQNRKQPELP